MSTPKRKKKKKRTSKEASLPESLEALRGAQKAFDEHPGYETAVDVQRNKRNFEAARRGSLNVVGEVKNG